MHEQHIFSEESASTDMPEEALSPYPKRISGEDGLADIYRTAGRISQPSAH